MNPEERHDPLGPGPFPERAIDPSGFLPEELAAEEAFIASLLSARFPDLDVSPGSSIYESWVRPGAVVSASAQKAAARLRRSMTVSGIRESSFSDLDPDAAGSLLSSFLMDTDSGELARGEVSVQVSSDRLASVRAGFSFVSESGVQFSVSETVSVPPSGMLQGSDGTWTFRVPVVADSPGESGNVPAGEPMVPQGEIPLLVRAYAAFPFSGGRSGSSPRDIASAVLSSVSRRSSGTPASMLSLLKSENPEVDRVSAVGSLSPLMSRNKGGVQGFPRPGFEDVYVRTFRTLSSKVFRTTATKVSGRNYVALVPRDAFPGHAYVSSVVPVSSPNSSGGLEVSSFSRKVGKGWPGSLSTFPGREPTARDCAFSMWQESEVGFSLPEGGPEGGPEEEVDLVLVGLPWIDGAQEVLSADETLPVGVDRVVKGFVPCIVSVGGVSVKTEGGADRRSVKSGIEAAFMREVADASGRGGLRADRLICAFMSVQGVQGVDVPLRMSGTLVTPDGGEIGMSSTSVIRIPDRPELGFGPYNADFFPDPRGIEVTVYE